MHKRSSMMLYDSTDIPYLVDAENRLFQRLKVILLQTLSINESSCVE